MKSPWICHDETGLYGKDCEWQDADSRLGIVRETTDPAILRQMIAWPATQQTVRLAAERRLRKVTRSVKSP